MPVPIALNFLQLNVGVHGVVEPEGVGGGGEIKIYAFFSICFYILQVLSQRRDGAHAARPGTDGAPAARPGTDQCIIKIKNVKKTNTLFKKLNSLILHPSDFVKIERFTYSKLQMCLVSCLVFGFQKHFELSIRNLVYQGHLI